MKALLALLRRELLLLWRQRGEPLIAVAFFLLAALVFAFGAGPDAVLLQRIAPGVLWVSALFAVVLSLERIFEADLADGALDQLALSLPLPLVVAVKALVHWLGSGFLLLLAAPLVALAYDLAWPLWSTLLLTLLLGTPSLSLIGTVVAATALGARRGGVLIPLLALPLSLPVLILGVTAIDATAVDIDADAHLLLLGAALLFALPLSLVAAPAALRQALEAG
ncbi:MAG TPA: heme exporter protein CcmB [Kiloniellales bacterium]|nr:heme exporter protein CcmB [Kiloniellales bacterium]